ncbi:phage pi2 protein 07 [Paenibacillus sp. LBL]|uniref:DUF771 domain-containing protein n=1 Tax=Paenibacillus sp. LBL TaxID=2940563 RepID=UPI002474E97B|nr:DUF771 domain-containing protein [Paenibacillus sp. LBL]MDH6673190.1 phage pi2 protein 07 [Paenibacillus sp. LBL]
MSNSVTPCRKKRFKGEEPSATVQVIVDHEFVRKLAKEEMGKILDEAGTWWDMKRLEHETCRKRDWLISNVLLNPKFKLEMEEITNGCEGGRWMFRAILMKDFLDKHFHHLNRSVKSGKIS